MPDIDLNFMVNTSYLIFCLSYLMRDILWLRALTVIGYALWVPYLYFQPERLWEVIAWSSAFLVINILWISKLVFDRRPVRFTPEQRRLWQTALHRLSPRHARVLFKTARHQVVSKNETMVKHGQTLDYVALIAEGEVTLTLDDHPIERLGPGHFIGSAMLLESQRDFRSVTAAFASKDCRLLVWKTKDIRRWMRKDDEFSTAFEATLGLDLTNLLIRAWNRVASPEPSR